MWRERRFPGPIPNQRPGHLGTTVIKINEETVGSGNSHLHSSILHHPRGLSAQFWKICMWDGGTEQSRCEEQADSKIREVNANLPLPPEEFGENLKGHLHTNSAV